MDSSEQIDMHADPTAGRGGRMGRWITAAVAAVPALATFLALADRWAWQLELLSLFHVQYAVILLILLVLMLFLRRWRLAWLVLIPLTINIALILPLFVHPRWFEPKPEFLDQQPDPGPTLGIMTYNMNGVFQATESSLDAIRQSNADIILLQGVDAATLGKLEYAVAPFRVYLSDTRPDGYGLALLLRVSIRPAVVLDDARIISLDGSDDPRQPRALVADFRWQGRKVTLLTFKAVNAVSARQAAQRQAQLQGIIAWVKQQDRPVIIAGDLGMTPWASTFSQLLEDTHLYNSQLGYGISGTWPATGGILGQMPVDHILLSPSFVASKRWLGPSLSSSHQSLNIELQWAGGAANIEPTPYYSDDDDDDDQRGLMRHIEAPSARPRGLGRGGRRWRRENRNETQPATQAATRPGTQPASQPATQ